MLTLRTGGNEYYDERQSRFIAIPQKVLRLEHSLRSVARWESKWNVPFLSDKEKTREQSLDYIQCMVVDGYDITEILPYITLAQMAEVNEYIGAKMTATTITHHGPKKINREIITAEIIYFWMIQLGIPPEYEKWHLNRLLMLIEVCNAKGGQQKKMSRREQMAMQRSLNAERCAKLHTRG